MDTKRRKEGGGIHREIKINTHTLRFPGGTRDKEPACQCNETQFDLWVRKITWRRAQQPTAVFLPRISHGQRTLAGYSPWGYKESDTTELLIY